MKKHALPLAVILGFSLFGMKALFHPGLFTAHDIGHQVARIYYYFTAVKHGQFPPYWISNLAANFGYPLFFFSYHLPWLISLPFLFVGLTIPVVLKLLFLLAYLTSGITMYFLSQAITKNRLAALLSTLLYLWAPLRFRTILVSAAMGVAWAEALAPLLLLGLYRRQPLLIALGLSGLILSHFISLIFLLPLIFFFLTLHPRGVKRPHLGGVIRGALLGLGLSAFYLMPALYYQPLSQASTGSFSQIYQSSFVTLRQLLYSPWGYDIIQTTAKEANLSFQLGIAHWLTVLISPLLLFRKVRNFPFLTFSLLFVFVFSLFMTLGSSRPIWDFVIKVLPLDYPTRFLLPAVLSVSLLAGLVLNSLPRHLRSLVALLLIAISLYTNRNHLRVNQYTDFPLETYISSELTTNTHHEYLPRTATIPDQFPPLLSSPATAIQAIIHTPDQLSLSYQLKQGSPLTLRQFAFPGQTLFLDSAALSFQTDPQGLIKFNSPAGSHHLSVRFLPTTIIKIAKLISLASLIILFTPWLKKTLMSSR